VDAVFGTGFSGVARGESAEAISRVAGARGAVLSVDIASGVSASDGSVAGNAVQADVTVAIQALKTGHVAGEGAKYSGRVDVADIGIPIGAASTFVPEPADVAAVLPVRDPDTHKYRVGVAVVVAGSAGMAGAAALTASGAARAGAGLVILGVPRSSLDAAEATVTEAVKVPLPDTEGALDAKAVDELGDRLDRAGALALGPGLGRAWGAAALVRRVLDLPMPLVLDADALYALAEILSGDRDVLRRRSAPTVLTPHAGEFARLAGAPPGDDPVGAVRAAAVGWGCIVHLKGRRAITATPDGRAWVNPTGNPAMASGGTGDVLTGVIASLCCQGLPPADATWAGAYVHGAAGDLAIARAATLVAGDVAACLPSTIERLRRGPHPVRGSIRTALEAP
jgi:NAD(P)H-hydrate epimerase